MRREGQVGRALNRGEETFYGDTVHGLCLLSGHEAHCLRFVVETEVSENPLYFNKL